MEPGPGGSVWLVLTFLFSGQRPEFLLSHLPARRCCPIWPLGGAKVLGKGPASVAFLGVISKAGLGWGQRGC